MTKVSSGNGSRDGYLRYLRGFYLKILIWFWLAASLLLGAVLITASITVNPGNGLPQQQLLQENLGRFTRFLSSYLATGHTPSRALAAVKGSDNYSLESSLILVSPDGEWLSDSAVATTAVKVAVSQLLNGHRIDVVIHPSEIVVGPQHLYYEGEAWHVFMVWQNRALWWKRLVVMMRTYPGLLFMALVASGLLCFLLVAWLVSPLRRLQSGVRQITNGDLDARLPQKLTQRRDEVGVLCRDFNIMAKRLQALDNSNQRLLRDVSHELRSPLTRLQLALALARSKSGDLASSEHERMERDIDRLNGMIGQILVWSRMSTAVNGPAPEEFSFDQVIRELVDNADFEAAMAGHSVLLIRCDTCSFFGVHDWLESAVENIVRNAIRFSPPTKNVEVRLLRKAEDVEICIRDYGPGVPEQDISHLFEPFFRVDETRGGDNGGTGLGMAIARAAVDSHSGIIRAENANPGLRITICLPFRTPPCDDPKD